MKLQESLVVQVGGKSAPGATITVPESTSAEVLSALVAQAVRVLYQRCTAGAEEKHHAALREALKTEIENGTWKPGRQPSADTVALRAAAAQLEDLDLDALASVLSEEQRAALKTVVQAAKPKTKKV